MSLCSLSNMELRGCLSSSCLRAAGFPPRRKWISLGNAGLTGENQTDPQGSARWEGQGMLAPRKGFCRNWVWNRTARRRLDWFICLWGGSWETLLRDLQELCSCLGRWLLQPEYPQHQKPETEIFYATRVWFVSLTRRLKQWVTHKNEDKSASSEMLYAEAKWNTIWVLPFQI